MKHTQYHLQILATNLERNGLIHHYPEVGSFISGSTNYLISIKLMKNNYYDEMKLIHLTLNTQSFSNTSDFTIINNYTKWSHDNRTFLESAINPALT